MNDTGHIKSLERLFKLYEQSNSTLYRFYCVDNHTDEDGNTRHLNDFIKHGVLGADSPNNHKCNEIALVKSDPGATPIIDALKAGISWWQGEPTDNILTRMYHFYDTDGWGRVGCKLIDDPAAQYILLGLALVDPVVLTYVILDYTWIACPLCFGTGAFGYCLLCGGDGQVFDEIVEDIRREIRYVTSVGVDTYFGYFPDVVNHTFHSAEHMYDIYRKNSLELFDSNKESSLIYQGYGLHGLQDIAAIPYHSSSIPFSQGHAEYENTINYTEILDNISWDDVQQEYNDLIALLQENAASPSSRWNANALMFHWACRKSKAQDIDSVNDFSNLAASLLATMHHCLNGFYVATHRVDYTTVRSNFKNIFHAYRYQRESWKTRNLKSRMKIKPIKNISEKRMIKKLAKNWTKRAKQAIARREPLPLKPLAISKPVEVTSQKRLNLKSLVERWNTP